MTKLQPKFVLLLTTIDIHLHVRVQKLMFVDTGIPPTTQHKILIVTALQLYHEWKEQ